MSTAGRLAIASDSAVNDHPPTPLEILVTTAQSQPSTKLRAGEQEMSSFGYQPQRPLGVCGRRLLTTSILVTTDSEHHDLPQITSQGNSRSFLMSRTALFSPAESRHRREMRRADSLDRQFGWQGTRESKWLSASRRPVFQLSPCPS